ncbi:hypothetical protein ACRALDRAFT_2032937, partial [Sodiomyces alcalophilus JCM 7366]|uniref:uncharacterized protein n=1 Tax=Sodiomyces alcalophilus JCM 7366 TaxID=591952 RepID=UPI0039B37591
MAQPAEGVSGNRWKTFQGDGNNTRDDDVDAIGNGRHRVSPKGVDAKKGMREMIGKMAGGAEWPKRGPRWWWWRRRRNGKGRGGRASSIQVYLTVMLLARRSRKGERVCVLY